MTEKETNLDEEAIKIDDLSVTEPIDCIDDERSSQLRDSDSVSKLKTILEFATHIVRLGVQVFVSVWRFKH